MFEAVRPKVERLSFASMGCPALAGPAILYFLSLQKESKRDEEKKPKVNLNINHGGQRPIVTNTSALFYALLYEAFELGLVQAYMRLRI